MESAPRSPRVSQTLMTELVLPQHANSLGTAFGGAILSWIDICAAIAAQRHCGGVAVTAAIDEMEFRAPVHVGDVLCLHARVNAAFRTSLEVECVVERECAGAATRALCADALLTFVARDRDGGSVTAPPLLLETDEDRRRYEAACRRRQARLSRRASR